MATRNRLRFVRALAGSVAVLVAVTGLASADEIALERGASEVADTLLEELGEAMTREDEQGGPDRGDRGLHKAGVRGCRPVVS
jgi:hypothetical protein